MKVCVALVFAVVAALAAQTPPIQGTVRIVQPSADALLSGPTLLSADVQPASLAITEVEFFVDGRIVCRVGAAPFVCPWDAGNRLSARSIRVVAVLTDGRRVTQTVRTKGLDVTQGASVDVVLVSVHVTDRDGRFVPGLDAGKFKVLEDGQLQQVSSFVAQDAPAEVVLVLDMSGSMASAVQELKTSTTGFLNALRPKDVVTLAAFNTEMAVLAPRTADRAARLAALEGLKPEGPTALYDAMIEAVDLLKGQLGRRAIVVFTDGDDDDSRSTAESVRAVLETNDIVLYMIAQGKAAVDKPLRELLTDLALQTGGAAYFGSHMSDLSDHFAHIVDDLANQYVIGYSPIRPLGDGRLRKIAVQVADGGKHYIVRARQSYLALRRQGAWP